ncbi:MAG: four helix bundle protein [Fusobacteriaceae bacterium]|nr:four helix bundle protein [Fusobacteriaceae bacterium]
MSRSDAIAAVGGKIIREAGRAGLFFGGQMAYKQQSKTQSELTVVTKTKDLCSYIMTITQKSPKQFRFTFISKLQNLALDAIENIYRANDIFIGPEAPPANRAERLSFQHKALTDLKILAYIAELSMTQGCILMKQFEQIAKQTTDCQRLLGAWINSDKKR